MSTSLVVPGPLGRVNVLPAVAAEPLVQPEIKEDNTGCPPPPPHWFWDGKGTKDGPSGMNLGTPAGNAGPGRWFPLLDLVWKDVLAMTDHRIRSGSGHPERGEQSWEKDTWSQ